MSLGLNFITKRKALTPYFHVDDSGFDCLLQEKRPALWTAFTLPRSMTSLVAQDEDNRRNGGVSYKPECFQPGLLWNFAVLSLRPHTLMISGGTKLSKCLECVTQAICSRSCKL